MRKKYLGAAGRHNDQVSRGSVEVAERLRGTMLVQALLM
jgi:hypothetical protein